MAGKVENASSCLQWGNGRTPCLVCAGAGCGGRILEFIKRCAEPTSLGGLKMVATVLAGCLLLVGGGKSSMSFCLLPPQSECPTPCAPAPSKPLGCTTSYIKQWILWLDSHMGFFHLLVYFGGYPWAFCWWTGDSTDVHKKLHLLCRKMLAAVQAVFMFVWSACLDDVAQSPEVCSDLTCQQEGFTSQIEDR